MPNVRDMPVGEDGRAAVEEHTDRLVELYRPGGTVLVDEDPDTRQNEPAPQYHYVNHLGTTEDGLLTYNYTRRAKYGLKLPERNKEIFLPNASSVSDVLVESGRQRITKWTVYDYFNTRRRYGPRIERKLEGAVLRKLD